MFAGLDGWVTGIRELLDVDTSEYPDAKIQSFLYQGEVQLNRKIRTRYSEIRAYTEIANDENGQVILPSNFQEMRSIFVDGTDFQVELVSPDEFHHARRNYNEAETYPQFAMIVGNTMHFHPMGLGQTVIIVYYSRVPHLIEYVDSAVEDQTTVFTEYYPDALLYASALAAAPYMLDDVRLPMWREELARILDEIDDTKAKDHYGSAPLKRRMRVHG